MYEPCRNARKIFCQLRKTLEGVQPERFPLAHKRRPPEGTLLDSDLTQGLRLHPLTANEKTTMWKKYQKALVRRRRTTVYFIAENVLRITTTLFQPCCLLRTAARLLYRPWFSACSVHACPPVVKSQPVVVRVHPVALLVEGTIGNNSDPSARLTRTVPYMSTHSAV